jgi:hypothetical protein
MIRVVAFRKAIVSGLCGAAVIEAVSFVSARSGLPTIDLVSALSQTQFRHLRLISDLAALVAHLGIGVCWAVFYAFFFWGRFHLRPIFQGLLFALLPATLAIFVVYPELALMRASAPEMTISVRSFFAPLNAATVASLLFSHALFGLTLGVIYRRPVGYGVEYKPPPPVPLRRRSAGSKLRRTSTGFMFATGIECSYPTTDHGRWRCDQMDSTGHYQMWQRDFELAREIGVTHIRYGPPLHLIFDGPGRYDWDYIDPQMQELRELGPEPIVDLCHFGVPSWLGDFQNRDIGRALEEYAGAFAGRFPWCDSTRRSMRCTSPRG